MISRCCLYRTCPSSIAEPNVRPGRIFTAGETGSYLCAACTCGQAISTALMREDESKPSRNPARGEGDLRSARKYLHSNAEDSHRLRSASARQFVKLEQARMSKSGQRESGENVRMGLQLNAIKEIEELKSEIAADNSAPAAAPSEGDSAGISLIELAEILVSTRSGWNRAAKRASRRISAE